MWWWEVPRSLPSQALSSPQPQLSVTSALSTFLSLVCWVLSNSVDCSLLPGSLPCCSVCLLFHSLFSISGSCFVSTSEILNTGVFLQHFVLVARFTQRTSLPGNCIHAFPEAVLCYYVQGQVSSAERLSDSVWPLEYWFISLYGHFMKGISQFLMSKWWVVDNIAQRSTTCLPEWHPEFNLPHFQTKQH